MAQARQGPRSSRIPSLRLREVQKLAEQPGDVHIDDISDYIDALLNHDRQRKEAEEVKQRQELEAARRRTWVAAAAAFLLLLVAVFAVREVWVANEQKARADKQTETANEQRTIAEQQRAAANEQKAVAETQKALAEKQTRTALKNETHALAALSRAAAREERALDGVELAVAAWPRGAGMSETPMLGDALQYLSLSFSERPPIGVLNHGGAVSGAVYSPDGRRILSWSDDKTLRLWDAATGAAIGEPMRHEDVLRGAVYSPDGKRICRGLMTRRCGCGTRRPARRSASRCSMRHRVFGAVYSPDGKRILSWSCMD